MPLTNLVRKIAFLSYEVGDGVNGGVVSTGAWQTRPLNTIVDPQSITSLVSNQFVLQAGTYVIRAKSNTYRASVSKCRLQNITDTATVKIGLLEEDTNAAGDHRQMFLDVIFTITSAKTYEFQVYISQNGILGDGNALAGVAAVHASIEIEKLI